MGPVLYPEHPFGWGCGSCCERGWVPPQLTKYVPSILPLSSLVVAYHAHNMRLKPPSHLAQPCGLAGIFEAPRYACSVKPKAALGRLN